MTARNWIGGRNGNQASSAANWSPTGAPLSGDTLTIDHGTMQVTGSALGNDDLHVTGNATVSFHQSYGDHLIIGVPGPTKLNATVNLSNSAVAINQGWDNLKINAAGTNWLALSSYPGYRATNGSVTIKNSGTLVGSVGGLGTSVRIDGGTFYNQDSHVGLDGGSFVINSKVAGDGSWTLGTYHAPYAKLEFMQSVSSEQTINLESGVGYGLLQIDQPSTFRAKIGWASEQAIVDLNKLAADSYKYDASAGALDFFSGNRMIYQLHVEKTSPYVGTYAVAKGTSTGGAGVELYSKDFAWKLPHGADLPVHT